MVSAQANTDTPPAGRNSDRRLWNRLTHRAARLRIAAQDAYNKGASDHGAELNDDADILLEARNRLFPHEPSW